MPASPEQRPEDITKVRPGADGSSTDAGKHQAKLAEFASSALTTRQTAFDVEIRRPDSASTGQNPFVFKPATNGMRSEPQGYDKLGNEITTPYDSSRKAPEVARPSVPPPVLEHPRYEPPPHADTASRTFKLTSDQYGSGQRVAPDVVVRVPENFDPSKPVHMVVYNHGFYDSASSAYGHANLNDQMRDAPPNTVLVVPEWQTNPAAKSSADGDFSQKDQFKHLVNEAFSHIPELKGKTLDNVDSIHLISHSAGYKGLESELYRNGIENKVKSITMLDSMYNPTDLDPWLRKNIHALADGSKQFVNISNPGKNSTYAASRDQAMRVKGWLAEARLGRSNMYEDYDQTGSIVNVDKLQKYPIVFKLSQVTEDGKTQHMSLPNLYVHRVLQADDF